MNCRAGAPPYGDGMSLPALVRTHALTIVTGLLFGVAFWRLGLSPELPAVLAFIFGGVFLAVIDWRVRRLPTLLVYYTLAGVAAGLAFVSLVEWQWKPLATVLAGAALFSGVHFAYWFLSDRVLGFVVLGFGDVRLAMVLGVFPARLVRPAIRALRRDGWDRSWRRSSGWACSCGTASSACTSPSGRPC